MSLFLVQNYLIVTFPGPFADDLLRVSISDVQGGTEFANNFRTRFSIYIVKRESVPSTWATFPVKNANTLSCNINIFGNATNAKQFYPIRTHFARPKVCDLSTVDRK